MAKTQKISEKRKTMFPHPDLLALYPETLHGEIIKDHRQNRLWPNRQKYFYKPPIPERIKEEVAQERREFASWKKIVRRVATKFGHTFSNSFVFSDSQIEEVYDHILFYGVIEMKTRYDPTCGASELTFLYKIATYMAIDEYKRLWQEYIDILDMGANEYEVDISLFDEYSVEDKERDNVDFYDTFRTYWTVTAEEVQSTKRQYLPKSLRNLSDRKLQKRLTAIDREIIMRLSRGESKNEISKDIKLGGVRSTTDHRKFVESRCRKIIDRGKLEEPASWSKRRLNSFLSSEPEASTEEIAERKKEISDQASEQEKRLKRRERRRETQKARRAKQKTNSKSKNS